MYRNWYGSKSPTSEQFTLTRFDTKGRLICKGKCAVENTRV